MKINKIQEVNSNNKENLLICTDCGNDFLAYEHSNLFGNLRICPTCNAEIASSKIRELEEVESELEMIIKEQEEKLLSIKIPRTTDLRKEIGIVIDCENLCRMIAYHLTEKETKDYKLEINISGEFDEEDLREVCCTHWYGVKTLEIFEENNNQAIILAFGYWGGLNTKCVLIDLEDDVYEQVFDFISIHYNRDFTEDTKVAVFGNMKEMRK